MKLRPKGNVKNNKHWSHMFAPVIGISLKTSADSQNRSKNTQLQSNSSHFANHYKYMKALTS